MRAKSTSVQMLPSPDKISAVYQHAQLMKYPTVYLSTDDDFIPAMPPQSRFLARHTLSDGLRRMTCDLEATRDVVREQLQRRMFVNSLDDVKLTEIYLDDIRRQYDYEIDVAHAAAVGAPIPMRRPKARTDHLGFRLYWIDWDTPPVAPGQQTDQDEPDERVLSFAEESTVHSEPYDDGWSDDQSLYGFGESQEAYSYSMSDENLREWAVDGEEPHCKQEAEEVM